MSEQPLVGMNVHIENLKELVRNLDVMDDVLGSQTEQAIDRLLMLAQGRLAAVYPAPIMGSRYRRTGLLGQLWAGAAHRIRRVERGSGQFVEGQISNARPGIEFVQSLSDQAPVHRGRWRTAEEVLTELQPEADRLLGLAGAQTVDRTAQI